MQTTQNTVKSQVDKLLVQQDSGDGDAEESAALVEHEPEDPGLLMALIQDEASLRGHAEQLDKKATELENDGDASAKQAAEEMRHQASAMTSLAAEVGRAASELKNDPHKKLSRRKVERLHASVLHAVSVGEEDMDTAEEVHAESTDHKENIRRITEARAHAEKEKKPAPSKPKVKKEKPKQAVARHELQEKHSHQHSVDEEDVSHHRTVFVRVKEKAEGVAHAVVRTAKTVWHTTCEVAEDVGEGIASAFHHGVDVVKHAAPVAFAVKMGKKALHAMTHPAETVSRLWHKATDLLPWHQEEAESSAAMTTKMAGVALVAFSPFSAPLSLSDAVMDKVAALHLPKLEVAQSDHTAKQPTATPLVVVRQHPDTVPFLSFLTRS